MESEKLNIPKEIKKIEKLKNPDELREYSEKLTPVIRMKVAENLNTPVDVLAKLSEDEESNVRWVVAMNPQTPTKCLGILALDEDPAVREGVAMNNCTPKEILESLSEDRNGIVRMKAELMLGKEKKLPEIDFNAYQLGIKIKASLVMESVSPQEADHLCKLLMLGKAVEKYLNHEDYELREIMRYGLNN